MKCCSRIGRLFQNHDVITLYCSKFIFNVGPNILYKHYCPVNNMYFVRLYFSWVAMLMNVERRISLHLVQHRRSWADVVQMLYKCFLFAEYGSAGHYIQLLHRRKNM